MKLHYATKEFLLSCYHRVSFVVANSFEKENETLGIDE